MTTADERHFWTALGDLAERRIRLILGAHERAATPIYDPQQGSAGAGRTCGRCRKVQRYDRRVCGSCGYINR